MTYRAYLKMRKEAFKEGLTWERVLRIATAGACILMFAIVVGQVYMWEGRQQGREDFKYQVMEFKQLAKELDRRLTDLELDLQNEEEARLDLLAYKIMTCESGRNHNAIGDNGLAQGIAQYHKRTFYDHAKKAGLQNPNWHNQHHQILLLKWAIWQGIADKHWQRCYREAVKL